MNINTIIIFTLLNLFAILGFGQELKVKCTVLNKSGDFLHHARVVVQENPEKETFTDSSGNFTISAMAEQHLVVEFKNEARKIFKVSEIKDSERIVLGKGSELLNVGFNTKQRREEIASSVGNIRSNELEGNSVIVPGESLYGKISGLRTFQNTGYTPDERQPSMNVRGQATMRDNSMLVLIDGIERPLDVLALEEVESVSVLRDAAAKAKYGQRGANGVLLVRTKRGSMQKNPQFNISFDQGITQPTRVPEFLNAPEYARSVNEAMKNDGYETEDLIYNQYDISRFESGKYPTLWPNVDWVDQTIGKLGQFSRFNFNVSGGLENVAYHLNLNYQNELGLFKHTEAFEDFSTQLDYDKFNFRTNVDIDFTANTFAFINVAGYVSSTRGPKNWDNVASNSFNIPSALFPIKNFDGSWGGSNQFNNNPVAMLSDAGHNTRITNHYLVDIGVKQNLDLIAEGLSAVLKGSFDNQGDFWENQVKTYQFKEVNPVIDTDGNIIDTSISQLGEDSDLSPTRTLSGRKFYQYDVQGKIKYSNSFNGQNIGAWILFNQRLTQIRGVNTQTRRRNLAGNLHYGLADKYFFDASLSYYGTSKIQDKQDRYGLFPAIAGAWLISNESFMSNVKSVNSLKLKASYGKVGNGLIPRTDLTHMQIGWDPGIILGTDYRYHGGLAQNQIPIERKKWESSYESNVGIEAFLFNQLEFNGELFYTKRKNIFVPSAGQYSEALGILPEQIPNGIVENKGYELDITWSNQSGDFTYYITGMFSQYQNKIINMNEQYRPYGYMKREGESIGQRFGWETLSKEFYSSESDIENSPTSQFGDVSPGDIKYKDQNEDGIIDEFDQHPIGYPSAPEIYYSTNFGLGYKGLHFTVTFQGTENSSAYLNRPNVFWPLRARNGNISTWYDNYWSQNNKEDVDLPRLTTESNNNNFRANDIWIRDNSFLKLRTAVISYSLQGNFISKMGLEKVDIYLRGRNLFSWDNINYVDPENTGATYPSLRRYSTGINVTF